MKRLLPLLLLAALPAHADRLMMPATVERSFLPETMRRDYVVLLQERTATLRVGAGPGT